MKMKKMAAAAIAGIMMTAMALPVSAATSIYDTEESGWTSNNEFLTNSSSEFSGINFGELGLTSVTFHANCADLNWGWSNGQFNSNSNTGGWQQVSFGGSEANADVTITEVGNFDVTVPVQPNEGGWFNLGWGTGSGEGVFSIESIDFYAGETLLGTWADSVWTEAEEKIQPNVTYVQKTAVENGVYSERAVMMIKKEDAEAGKSVNVTFSNGTKSVTKTSKNYYAEISAVGNKITPDEGYVFVAVAITNIPEDVTLTATLTVE